MKKLRATLTVLILMSAALAAQTASMDKLGEQYVRLVLALGEHDPDYVDAYYGPAEWRRSVEQAKMSRPLIETQAAVLARQLAMKNRTTVYVVFVPGNIWEHAPTAMSVAGNREGEIVKRAFLSAASGPYSAYALLADRKSTRLNSSH